jgi:hypothetical protein
MVIAEKAPKAKERKIAVQDKITQRHERSKDSDSALSAVKSFVCKYLCK